MTIAASTSSAAGVPRAERPLRVAILGWARLSAQAREGSGYNLNASELARGLAARGHEVVYLASGMNYRARWLGLRDPKTPRIAEHETWGGVRCWDLLNAPNLSPAAMNFRNMPEEIESPLTTAAVLRWLAHTRAQVVHVHSLEGYGLDLIGAIEASGVPVVVTPHNYWYVCPQVDLLHREREVCLDYDGGQRCVGCLPGKNPASLRRLRAFGQSLESWLGTYPADVIRKAVYGTPHLLRSLARGRVHRRWKPPVLNPDRRDEYAAWAGYHAVNAGHTAHSHTRPPSAGTRNGAAHAGAAHGSAHHADTAAPIAPIDLNERVLAGGVGTGSTGTKVHLRVLNSYGERRRAGVAALNAASLITPPSDYVRRVCVSMGVDEDRTRCVLLGQPHFDEIHRRAMARPFYRQRPWDANAATRPLRLAFFGTTRPNKGVEVLAKAVELLDPGVRARAQIIIRAQGNDYDLRRRLAHIPEVSVWGGYDLWQLMAAGGEYDVGILSHIWLENSPLVLLENLHAGKFVITPRLGGPPEWIVDPDTAPGGVGNGLMFAGGDAPALARQMERCIRGEVIIPSPAEIHAITPALRSYPEHVLEVESIYAEVLDRARGGASPRGEAADTARVVVRASGGATAAGTVGAR